MVKGNEPIVYNSFTWEKAAPNPDEIAWLRNVHEHMLTRKVGVYSDALDPTITDYTDESRLIRNSYSLMAENGLWMVIATNRRRESMLQAQAGIALAKNMRVVLAYQDRVVGSLPFIESLAKDGGEIFYWEDGQDFHDAIEDVLIPMCDNSTNDFNTEWTYQRKTA